MSNFADLPTVFHLEMVKNTAVACTPYCLCSVSFIHNPSFCLSILVEIRLRLFTLNTDTFNFCPSSFNAHAPEIKLNFHT
ncbi:hypothetical protein Pnap_3197 [Polaromonas naphthalenivorans CJ2]|uniref:Uncharacterized protein n=1 Tax=Polaromonas naphthalenivorans (strain CJ2) TaxID=365044 RepID=A1VS67_POLNA|nr:hypothetical protein Pnap_3197 [Polaromonas naphthalenivorans CJ2]